LADLKQKYSDFIVKEEINLKPKKKGKYALALLKKWGTSTLDVIEDITKKLKIPISQIGRCGIKDKNAITYQYLSLPKRNFNILKGKNYILKVIGFIDNPLSQKNLLFNHFEIIVRNLTDFEKRNFESRKDLVKYFGFPNYYGKQRFLAYKEKTFFIEDLEKGDIKAVFEKIISNRKLKIKPWYKNILKAYQNKNFDKNLIPVTEIEMQYSILHALEFNRKLSKLIKENYEKKAYLHSKIGLLYFPLEKILKIPENLEIFDNYYKKSFKRKTIVKPLNFKYKYIDKETLKLKFSLPKGSYATVLTSFLFHAVNESN